MNTHFNQHDPSITDAQNEKLQEKISTRFGEMRFWDFLLRNFDTQGDESSPPAWRLGQYFAEMTFEKWDILRPAIAENILWDDAINEILSFSLHHKDLTLAFDQIPWRYRVAFMWPPLWSMMRIEQGKIQTSNIWKIYFYHGQAFILNPKK